MSIQLLIARVLLALVFAVAGLAKLADLAGSRQALADFGVPAVLASPLGVALPCAELAVAIALVPAAIAWWGAMGALALLLLFIGGISYNMARGRAPDCHCFGQLFAAPAGWFTLGRNLILAAVAGLIVWQGRADAGPSMLAWMGSVTLPESIALVFGVIVIVLLALVIWVVFEAVLQMGRLLHRLETLEARVEQAELISAPAHGSLDGADAPAFELLELSGSVEDGRLRLRSTSPDRAVVNGNTGRNAVMSGDFRPGEPAPAVTLPDFSGRMVSLADFRGSPILVLFWNPRCGFCAAMLKDLKAWESRPRRGAPRLLVISTGTVVDNQAQGLRSTVLLDQDFDAATMFGADGTPTAVLLDENGYVASELASGAAEVLALARPAHQGNTQTSHRIKV